MSLATRLVTGLVEAKPTSPLDAKIAKVADAACSALEDAIMDNIDLDAIATATDSTIEDVERHVRSAVLKAVGERFGVKVSIPKDKVADKEPKRGITPEPERSPYSMAFAEVKQSGILDGKQLAALKSALKAMRDGADEVEAWEDHAAPVINGRKAADVIEFLVKYDIDPISPQ